MRMRCVAFVSNTDEASVCSSELRKEMASRKDAFGRNRREPVQSKSELDDALQYGLNRADRRIGQVQPRA